MAQKEHRGGHERRIGRVLGVALLLIATGTAVASEVVLWHVLIDAADAEAWQLTPTYGHSTPWQLRDGVFEGYGSWIGHERVGGGTSFSRQTSATTATPRAAS